MSSKVRSYKGFKIEEAAADTFNVFTADEWGYGKGFRYPEWEASSLEEAKQFIDSY